jgi:hypothetical protein
MNGAVYLGAMKNGIFIRRAEKEDVRLFCHLNRLLQRYYTQSVLACYEDNHPAIKVFQRYLVEGVATTGLKG